MVPAGTHRRLRAGKEKPASAEPEIDETVWACECARKQQPEQKCRQKTHRKSASIAEPTCEFRKGRGRLKALREVPEVASLLLA